MAFEFQEWGKEKLLSLVTYPWIELNLLMRTDLISAGTIEDKRGEMRRFHVSSRKFAALLKLDLRAFDSIDPFKLGLPGAGEAVARMTKWGDISLGQAG